MRGNASNERRKQTGRVLFTLSCFFAPSRTRVTVSPRSKFILVSKVIAPVVTEMAVINYGKGTVLTLTKQNVTLEIDSTELGTY